MLRHTLMGLILAAGMLLQSGCGGGGTQTGTLVQNVSIIVANYLVLDLASGDVEARSDVPNLATSSEYRRTKMVFKAISAGANGIGQAPGSFSAQADESPGTANVRKYYIAVFEMTQAQWQVLAGTTPWTLVNPTSVVGGIINSPEAPAFDIRQASVTQTLASASSRLGVVLDLPTDDQWEYACRAGGAGIFCWGSSRSDLVARTYAQVGETAAGATGPLIVGSLSPNGYGLFDMHGNVWEMTKSGTMRGGSWSDTLTQARSANKVTLDPQLAHALVGMRLVLVP
ncbi:MAG: SUMF1/EgtB/PvdO family nonheme iron enzyme [Planctomycetes bacterium]|nr:SUMF1/EgtB/PvdO family nonheme iron enzyme [Planctomycetota bacterium]